ncbi:MAG: metabolism protein [Segetibacter sp.]|nr:metabolism protein [Segetibacter sp.]
MLVTNGVRKYGNYYYLSNVETIRLSFDEQTINGTNIAVIADEKEDLYQKLWQQYFTTLTQPPEKIPGQRRIYNFFFLKSGE